MSNLLDKAKELQIQIDEAIDIQNSLYKKEEELSEKEESIKQQNIVLVKEKGDLATYQSDTKKLETELLEREKQIIVKERSFKQLTDTLTQRLTDIKLKEEDLKRREEKLVKNEAEAKALLDKVTKQELLNNEERKLAILRKSKLGIKEQQIDSEIKRLEGLGI